MNIMVIFNRKHYCAMFSTNKTTILSVAIAAMIVSSGFSCSKDNDRNKEKEDDTISLDGEIAKRIIHDDAGVTSGDGMYSILLPDGRSIFLMGDSFTGKVTAGARSTSDHMFRNTYQIYDNGKVSAITTGNDHSAAVPQDYPDERKWYWPGHGFVAGNTLYIFQFLMYQATPGTWGFKYQETHALEYSLPDIKLIRDYRIPYNGTPEAMYGAAALYEGGQVYVYAQYEKANSDPLNLVSQVLCARTTVEGLDSKWEYYTGSGWSDDSSKAVPLTGLSSVPVSSQFNVFKLRDKYILLTQHKMLGDGRIFTAVSDTPYGPWYNLSQIYKISGITNPHWYTYNAMAHPQFERDGKILVSFCVNTEDLSELFSNVESYRPRFFWYPVDKILSGGK